PKLFTAALEALASKDAKKIKEDLGRLAEKSSVELDLKAWAIAAGGAAGGGARPTPQGVDAPAAVAEPAQAGGAEGESKKKTSLDTLAKDGPEEFDAGPWAKRAYGKAAPVTKAEITELLKTQRYDDAVDALYLRSPAAPVVTSCASDKGLKEYSAKRAAEARTEAKKAIMCLDYAFSGEMPRHNMDFWGELSVSGWRTSKDQKRMTGVLLGDGDATPSNAAFYADTHFARAFMMESL